jgi:hypothetical protein
MRILLVTYLLIGFNALALDINDIFEGKILKILPQNTVVLDRGLEDYINPGDHIKFKLGDQFIARGVALKSNMRTSYWKIYRIPNPQLISTNYQYDIHSMLQSEIPDYVRDEIKYTTIDYDLGKMEKKIDDRIMDQTKNITSDLPSNLQNSDPEYDFRMADRAKDYELPGYQTTFNEDINPEAMNYYFYISPYRTERVNNNKNANYGFLLGTNKNKKHQVMWGLDRYESSRQTQFSTTKYQRSFTRTNVTFNINRMTPSLSFFMRGEYYTEKNSDDDFGIIYPVKRQTRYGLAGIKWHAYEGEMIRNITLSYIPYFENRVSEIKLNPTSKIDNVQKTIRHSLGFKFKSWLSKEVYLYNTLFWRPAMKQSSFSFDFNNADIENSLSFGYMLNKYVSFDYTNIYTNDRRLRDDNGIEPINIVHQFNFKLNF